MVTKDFFKPHFQPNERRMMYANVDSDVEFDLSIILAAKLFHLQTSYRCFLFLSAPSLKTSLLSFDISFHEVAICDINLDSHSLAPAEE